ncbi:hypothetical protein [Portibacter marinus]|uniref:hypothetical protein n=1 Tax=Portibacter marinus TaxID=2898660 RepID=UPI001F260CC6|nr:hypothetical protein [Portibacter marinus]
MKIKSIFTDYIRRLSVYSTLSTCIFLLCVVNIHAGNLINITSIKVSKDYPASFVLELEKQDIVTVSYGKNSGNADLKNLEVQIIDLNQQEEEVIATFNRSGRDFLAAYEGTYRVDFIYTGRGSGILKERSLDLSLKIDIQDYEGVKEGESKEVLHATNAVIEEGEANALKVVYYLTEGDKITISSTDKKAAFLKLNITQQPKIMSIRGSTVIDITSDGTYTFNFYLDDDDEGTSLLNLRDLLSRDDILFRDLSIYRERAVDYSEMVNNTNSENSTGGENEDLFDNSGNADAEGAESDPGMDIAKLIAEGNKSSEELALAIAETMKEMQETLNKKNVITQVTSIPNDIELRLEPELNFAANNENRKCEIITLQPTNFNIWFYWVGVGENAEEAFDIHSEEIKRVYRTEFSDAAAEYIYSKFGGTELGRKNPSYPDERRYSEYLNEDAEYAIVDTENMLKFMAGERYSKLNQPVRNAQFITADNGISGKAADDGDIYFCACNNNKATPVNVFFKFFAIDVEKKEF